MFPFYYSIQICSLLLCIAPCFPRKIQDYNYQQLTKYKINMDPCHSVNNLLGHHSIPQLIIYPLQQFNRVTAYLYLNQMLPRSQSCRILTGIPLSFLRVHGIWPWIQEYTCYHNLKCIDNCKLSSPVHLYPGKKHSTYQHGQSGESPGSHPGYFTAWYVTNGTYIHTYLKGFFGGN